MSLSDPNAFVRNSIEKAMADLPSLPNVVARVLEETENPSASAANIEKLIATDQALASKVLRVVNSAYYGLSGQVTSVGQAVVILGMQQVRNLVLSVGAISAMKPKTPRQQEVLKVFWLHSFAAAACGGLVGNRKNFSTKETEALFVAGLLHDIGRLFLFCNFTQTYDQVIQFSSQRGIVVERAEIQLLGMDHGGLGAEMARRWHLPEVLVDLIGRHEGPFDGTEDPINYALHYADQMTKHLYFPTGTPAPTVMDQHARDWLAFTEEDETWLREETDRKIEEATALFGLIAA